MSEEFYSVLDKISCGSAVFDDFLCGFLVSNRSLHPLCKMQEINKFNKKYATVIYATKPAVCVPGYNCCRARD